MMLAPVFELYEVAVEIGNKYLKKGMVSIEFESHGWICEVKRSEISDSGFAMKVIDFVTEPVEA